MPTESDRSVVVRHRTALTAAACLGLLAVTPGCLDRALAPLRPCTSSAFEHAVDVDYVPLPSIVHGGRGLKPRTV